MYPFLCFTISAQLSLFNVLCIEGFFPELEEICVPDETLLGEMVIKRLANLYGRRKSN